MNYRHAFHAGGPADVVKHAVLARILVHLREQAGGVPGDRHPCRRRPLRSARPGGDPQPRMARRHRAAAWPRRSTARRARCSRPISTRSPRSIAAGELATYPGFARARARAAAQPGPPRRLRARAERRGRARPQSRRRPARQGGRDRRLDRAQRLCAAAGAARRRPDRSAVRGRRTSFAASRRRSKPRTANGRPASSCSGTRSRVGRSPTRWRGACGARRSRKCCAPRSISQRSASRSGSRGCGLIVVNPPWTLAGELEILLPVLAKVFAGGHRVDWVARGE